MSTKNKALAGSSATSELGQSSAKVSDENFGFFSGRVGYLVKHFGSVAEVARRCGSSEPAVRKWLGGSEPSRDRCLALAKGTGASVLWLLGGVLPVWEAEMSDAERDTQTIVVGDQNDPAVIAAWKRRDAAIKGFAAGLQAAQTASDSGSQALRREELMMALQLAAEALDGKVFPPAKHAEMVSIIYECLIEGLPEATVVRIASRVAAV